MKSLIKHVFKCHLKVSNDVAAMMFSVTYFSIHLLLAEPPPQSKPPVEATLVLNYYNSFQFRSALHAAPELM